MHGEPGAAQRFEAVCRVALHAADLGLAAQALVVNHDRHTRICGRTGTRVVRRLRLGLWCWRRLRLGLWCWRRLGRGLWRRLRLRRSVEVDGLHLRALDGAITLARGGKHGLGGGHDIALGAIWHIRPRAGAGLLLLVDEVRDGRLDVFAGLSEGAGEDAGAVRRRVRRPVDVAVGVGLLVGRVLCPIDGGVDGIVDGLALSCRHLAVPRQQIHRHDADAGVVGVGVELAVGGEPEGAVLLVGEHVVDDALWHLFACPRERDGNQVGSPEILGVLRVLVRVAHQLSDEVAPRQERAGVLVGREQRDDDLRLPGRVGFCIRGTDVARRLLMQRSEHRLDDVGMSFCSAQGEDTVGDRAGGSVLARFLFPGGGEPIGCLCDGFLLRVRMCGGGA